MKKSSKSKKETRKEARKNALKCIFLSHFLVTPYIAYILHQLTEFLLGINYQGYGGMLPKLDWNYFRAWYVLIVKHPSGMRMWLLSVEMLFVAFMIYIAFSTTAEIAEVEEYPVTDYISIPVPAGNGQHGRSWFASEEDKKRLIHTVTIDGKHDMENLSERPGVVVGMERVNGKDHIQYLASFAHAIILALTGAGKTRRVLLETICLQLMANDSIVVSDVKGEIYYYTSEYAKKRGYQIYTIDLVNPLKSSRYNFLQPIIDALAEGKIRHEQRIEQLKAQMVEAKGDLEVLANLAKQLEIVKNDYSWTDKAQDYTWDLVAIFAGEQKGEPIWYNGETATLAACIMAICLEAPEECQNLYNVYNFIAYMSQVNPITNKRPLTAYLNTLPDAHPAKMIFMQSQVAAEETRASFNTSALGTLRLFTNPQLAEMSSKSDFNLEAIGDKKTAIYMIIPDEKKTYYAIASVFINQLYISQVAAARKTGGALAIPTDYDLDEIGNFPPIPVMANLLSVGRSRGIRVNLVLQDYQQLEAKYKEDFETIKSQCALKIFLKSDNFKTLEEISKSLGDYTVESASASASGSNTKDINISNSSNLSGRRLLFESELKKLRSPDALVMITSEDPMVTKLPDLSEYHFNKMLGLGDEAHNQRIITEREAKREEREYVNLPLWGIWDEYKKKLDEEAKRVLKASGAKMKGEMSNE